MPGATIPTVVYNQVNSTYGTGLNIVVPGHTVEGLKISQVYNLPKEGCLDRQGKLLADHVPSDLASLDVR